MTIEQLTTFFAWNSALNLGFLGLAALLVMAGRNWLCGIYHRLFGIERADSPRLCFQFLAGYEVLTIIFSVVPYLVLRFAM